jgi:cytochrome d ubiquinol oxidase subunit I
VGAKSGRHGYTLAVTEALLARGQMAYSLAFHIVFAAVGIAMPLMMVIAEVAWLRTKDVEYLALARRWLKGTAVFFAVGAVSGTVLSFELGLLFPRFMERAGPVIGMPFSLEGFAFFTEAIFLGLYFYGWEQLSPRVHLACGAVVALSGLLSAVFVTLVNAWMNSPCCLVPDVDPLGAMGTRFAFHEVLHGCLAAYLSTAFAVAAIHAWQLLRRGPSGFHQKALGIALCIGVPAAMAQPLVGHHAGQVVAEGQPMKLAALEGHVHTSARAPLHLGPIEVPGGLSLLAFNDPNAVVRGLEEIPREDWPPSVVRVGWYTMIGLGTLAALYAAVTAVLWLKRRAVPSGRRWLWATVVLGPSGVLALEAGWIVTEVGRQPWTIYGVLRTIDTLTPMTGLWAPFTTFAVIYLGLAVVVSVALVRQVRAT